MFMFTSTYVDIGKETDRWEETRVEAETQNDRGSYPLLASKVKGIFT